MKKHTNTLFAISLAALCMGLPGVSRADDAVVLPKGVWAVNVEDQAFLPIKKRYNHDGNVEDAAADFNTTLNQSVFPGLGAFQGPPFNIPNPNFGQSEVTFKYEFNYLNITIARGITDRLTAGVFIPYWWQRNNVTANLNNTNANIGLNPAYNPNSANPLVAAPFIPVAIGGVKLNTQDVQQLLGNGLTLNGNKIPGFGYKPIQTWSDEGFSDIEAGLKYQFYKSTNWRNSVTGGISFPTGKVDDPDNLVDRAFGKGSWGASFVSSNDYIGINDLVLDGTLKYWYYFESSQDVRIVQGPDQVISDNTAKVRIRPGSHLELQASAKYQFYKGSYLSLLYRYGRLFKDKVTLNGTELTGMEEQTDAVEQVLICSLTYSTVPLYVEKKFSVPMDVALSYRNRFAGTNDTLKSEYISLALTFYF
jgi:hypothetical protein